ETDPVSVGSELKWPVAGRAGRRDRHEPVVGSRVRPAGAGVDAAAVREERLKVLLARPDRRDVGRPEVAAAAARVRGDRDGAVALDVDLPLLELGRLHDDDLRPGVRVAVAPGLLD